jgi:two-component system phosphate regulon sensor histidine kinase PhoR
MGLYGALSLTALTGLLLSLNTRMGLRAEEFLEQRSADQLRAFCDEYQNARWNSATERQWTERLRAEKNQLFLMNSSGDRANIPVPLDDSGANLSGSQKLPEPPGPAMIRSIVQTTVRSGESSRWLNVDGPEDRVLVIARVIPNSGDAGQVAMMLVNVSGLRNDQEIITTVVTQGVFFTWLTGLICVGLIASGLVGPLQAMTANLGAGVPRDLRQDMLLRISDRNDELGHVAQSLTQLEESRRDQLDSVSAAERESRTTVELLTAVLNSMVEGVIAIDREERILFLNAAARQLLSISGRLGVGRRVYEAIRIPVVLDLIGDTLRTEQSQTLEFRMPRENVWITIVVSPFLKGPQLGAVAVLRDVSDLRRLEFMRRDFVSGVSHELKTPLTVIQACTDTLMEGAVDDPVAAKRFLTQISEQSERLLELILGMLQLSRVESGAEVFEMGPLDAAEIVRDVIDGFQPVAESRTVRLEQAGLTELTVEADPQALRTIVSNLVDNAIKYTAENGTVSVLLEHDADGKHLIVRDTGIGMAAEHLPRVFERFYRVDRGRSRDRGGTGLGLSIVKHLCLTLKAVITVKSEPGKGTEFRVTFP